MEKLKMQSHDVIGSNTQKIAQLFPNCVTERLSKEGKPELAIDFEKLQAELSNEIIVEGEERYQFTWPDKRAAVRLANTPTTMTLRPCREESVDFDNTQNLYIEGDNLDVLKVLRETYLGKVKMIYIDPPYNTGNDFVYNDDFGKDKGTFEETSGLFDEDGNQTIDPMQRNTESNGRFHTDWLNMIYPRLKVARDLLADDGVIFISLDDNEIENLTKVCNEIFGEENFIAVFPRLTTKSGKTPATYMISHDYVLCYVKSAKNIFIGKQYEDASYKYSDEYESTRGKFNLKQPLDCNSISYSASLDYPITHEGITYYPGGDYDEYLKRKEGKVLPKDYAWRWSKELFNFGLENGWIVFQNGRIYTKGYLNAAIEKGPNGYIIVSREKTRKNSTIDFISNEYSNDIAKKQVASFGIDASFDYPKPYNLVEELLSTYYNWGDAIVLDFFSGSSSTAEAVMRKNAVSKTFAKYIMVQLPEELEESNRGINKQYKTICDIAKERIRRAGKKVKEEAGLSVQNLDTGFRVLKLDTSNMEDIYYTPQEFELQSLFNENVKADRTNEDLLFQVMLDLGIELSAKIESKQIAGKNVHFVDDNYLVACFDRDVNESTITEIAKLQPIYFVMRDASAANDNVIDNFEQIFKHYSPDTNCRII
ncbi:MAG: site-specific DNA-methyltransferase [Bacteroidaceae bacterium]|nr:site-specific DNA-methyltransferase [Bacteroidaceae bacterium]